MLRFGDVTFDPARRLVLRGSRPVHLEPRALRLLELLLTCRPKALSKAEILDAVWPGTFSCGPGPRSASPRGRT